MWDTMNKALVSRQRQASRLVKDRKRREKVRQSKLRIIRNYVAINKEIKASPLVSSVEFLESFQWRKLRMEALKKYGTTCQCCGASRKTGAVINVDHIKPRKLYPHLALCLDNLQILCHECNHGKGNWDITDWR
jgi:5-methylcytosine-specific restriction endonuclease McrA